jgi:glycosyltransferase involved in cell wall biosynthesis
MTRVALVASSAVAGGAERALASLARLLPGSGVEPVAVLLQDGVLAEWLQAADCPTIVLRSGRVRQLHRTVATVAEIRSVLLKEEVDVVLSSQSKSHVYGGSAAALARLPAVWWQHEIPHPGRIEHAAGRVPAAAVVCGSQAAEKEQRRLTPQRTIVRIPPPGVDVAAVAARRGCGVAVRRALGWERNRIVGIVGRLQPSKGQESFLRAAAALAPSRPDLRFAVVGGAVLGWEGSYPEDLRNLAAELGIADRVHFAGHQDDAAPWFDACDVVVHAATNEPFGLVLVEAMALGRPLVASDMGGPQDLVEHSVSGLLVPPGRPQDLAAAVGTVLDDRELADRLSAGAMRRAELFTEHGSVTRFGELLRTIATKASSKRLVSRSHLSEPLG